MTTELQRAQDLLNAITAQRDQAMNAMVHAQAEIAARDRLLAEKDSIIAKLEAELVMKDELVAGLSNVTLTEDAA